MESSDCQHVLEVIESEFNELLKNPEIYVESQPAKTLGFKQLCEKSYSTAVSNNNKFKGKYLSKLLIDGFDDEQIWQQSDLLNKAALSNISQAVRSINPQDISIIVSNPNSLKPSSFIKDDKITAEIEDKTLADSDNVSSEDSNVEEDYAFDDDSDFSEELERDVKKQSSVQSKSNSNVEEDYAFDDDSDFSEELERDVKKQSSVQAKSNCKSVVDDKFFKISELREFLRIQDIKEEKGDSDDSSESDIDYTQDLPSDDDLEKSAKDVMYEDFFDKPASEDEDESDNNMADENLLMNHNLDDSLKEKSSMEEEDNDLEDFERNADSKDNQKSAFELEQEKIKKKIQECEKSMLEPLPWHLTGEVDASSRPIDSLIHHETDFDSNTRQDLLIDKAVTEKIEEITKMAIRNKAFFDVERKYKPTEEIINYKKAVALDQTKSKKSLAEVYEEDYLKKQSKQTEEEEDPKHKEIKKLMDSLFPQLHALFSHIPKPAIPEIKIISNLPAIAVEEVAPTSVSDVTLLAPEEVKKKSGLIKGKTERSDTDRKRERRKKKIHQKLKEKKAQEKLESLKANPSAKISKLQKIDTLKKLKQHKNTKLATVSEGGKIKSSKDFFSRLQDSMETRNKPKTDVSHKKKKLK